MRKSDNGIRKIVIIVMVFAISLFAAACAGSDEATQTTDVSVTTESVAQTTSESEASETSETDAVNQPDLIRTAALKGPTGLGLAHMVSEFESGKLDQNYEFSFAGSPDELTAGLISGQLDIAALPTNLASVLYQKTEGDIQLLAINTLGVLYVLEAGDSIQSFEDLEGREIAATGQGAVPEYVLSKLLTDYELNVEVSYRAEHSELATLAISGEADLVMLPEPFVTTVLSKREDMRRALDLTAVWTESQNSEGDLAMGCLVVSKSFAEEYPEAIESFLNDYKLSTEYANENPQETGELAAKYEIMADAGLAAKAIPNCYITMISGENMKPVLEPLLDTLLAANPQSVGGAIPDDDFYYVG